MYKVVWLCSNIIYACIAVFRVVVRAAVAGKDFSQDSSITDISCMECMFQDIKIESTGFLSVVFYLTNVKLLPPPLKYTIYLYTMATWHLLLSTFTSISELKLDRCLRHCRSSSNSHKLKLKPCASFFTGFSLFYFYRALFFS